LECDYVIGAFKEIGEENSIYCEAKNVKIVTPFEDINQVHPNYTNNDDVKGLSIANQTTSYFVEGIENVFKNLQAIEIDNCGLKIISKSDLQRYPKLKGLYLQFNRLHVLEKDLFVLNKDLQYINLHGNNLKYIDIETLPLLSLTFVNFGGNRCLDVAVEVSNRTALRHLKSTISESCQNADVLLKHEEDEKFNNVDYFITFHKPLFEYIRLEFDNKLKQVAVTRRASIEKLSNNNQQSIDVLEAKLAQSNQQVDALLADSQETLKTITELEQQLVVLAAQEH